MKPAQRVLADLAKQPLRKYLTTYIPPKDPPHIRALYTYPTSLRRKPK